LWLRCSSFCARFSATVALPSQDLPLRIFSSTRATLVFAARISASTPASVSLVFGSTLSASAPSIFFVEILFVLRVPAVGRRAVPRPVEANSLRIFLASRPQCPGQLVVLRARSLKCVFSSVGPRVDPGAAVLLGFLDSSARFLLRLTPSPLLPVWIFGFNAAAASFCFFIEFSLLGFDSSRKARPLPNWIFSLSSPLRFLLDCALSFFLVLALVTAIVYHRPVSVANKTRVDGEREDHHPCTHDF
jgi:hypothetical protein